MAELPLKGGLAFNFGGKEVFYEKLVGIDI
jgi:hypothetical protein